MPMQMYMITFKGGFSQDSSREVQRFVRQCGGLILMVTRKGPLVALDMSKASIVARHPLVDFMGAISLDPRGFAADQLQRIFAANLSKQLDLSKLSELETKS